MKSIICETRDSRRILFKKLFKKKKTSCIWKTLETGVSSTFGCIPINVVFARIIMSYGWKLAKSASDKASLPMVSAIYQARF